MTNKTEFVLTDCGGSTFEIGNMRPKLRQSVLEKAKKKIQKHLIGD
ncbi:MAG: hypothetical protein V2I33_24135 [Kangiellaceae bacterium]|jgi:hypothetical protein|nr:hypothetical protein [Kangiellaceae bacterium]